ncbi:MAG: 4Fe-4S dicluster domain-containing protein, partial [Atribacterota bacterium]
NLASFAEFEAFDEAQNFRVVDCIECGSCSYVCPSGIPITHLIKMAKVELLRRSRKGGK